MPLRCFFSTRKAQRTLAVFLDPVPERSVMGLETVAGPGAPAGEFALGFDVEIGSLANAVLDSSFTKLGLQYAGFSP